MFVWNCRFRIVPSHLFPPVFVAVLMVASVVSAEVTRTLPNQVLFEGLNGGELKLDSLKGKHLVIQFFASWCAGCSYTMPNVASLSGKSEIRYVPVSIDENIAGGRKFFAEGPASVQPFQKNAFWDKQSLAAKLGIRGPAVLVFDPHGRLLQTYAGHMKGREFAELEATLQRCRENEPKQAEVGFFRALWFWVFKKVFVGDEVVKHREGGFKFSEVRSPRV